MECDRHIVLDGACNVRDLSWPFGSQRRSGTMRIIRSAHLDGLSEHGRQTLTELGIGVVIDLRGRAEAAAAPSIEGMKRVHLPIEPTVVAELLKHHAAGTLTASSAVDVMECTYRRFIMDHAEIFAQVFEEILTAKQRPVLFHCAAGKDRTGVVAALILTAVDAEPSVIMEDYLLSNQFYRSPRISRSEIPDDVREVVLKVRPSYLEAAFSAMHDGWGGPAQYLKEALGIGLRERQALRDVIAAVDRHLII